MPSPTPQEITDLFTQTAATPNTSYDWISATAKITIMGSHPFSGPLQGGVGVEELVATRVRSKLEMKNHPPQREVVHVVGGGESDWAVVETKTTSRFANGKPYSMDNVFVIHFGEDNKADEVRIYIDAHHIVEGGK